MRLRSGADYVSSLRDGRITWLDGERIVDITADPYLKPTVEAFARYYDLMNDPQHNNFLLFDSPITGEKASVFLQPPRSREELQRRGKALEFVTREFGGLLTRPPDYDQAIMIGLLAAKSQLGADDLSFADNIDYWYAQMLKDNQMTVTAFNDPQIDRAKGLQEQGALRVVEKKNEGVIVAGARTLTTNAPFANELICLRKPVPPEASDFCLDCIIPLNTDGIQMICRPSLFGADREVRGRVIPYDELDAVVVFDNVFIPKENIFLLGRPDIVGKTWSTITGWSAYHDLIRSIVKAELFVGVISLIVDYIGTSRFPGVIQDLTEAVEYAESLRVFARAAEAQAITTQSGFVAPSKMILELARLYHHRFYPRMLSLVQTLSGQSLVSSPTEPYFERKEISPYLEKYFSGSGVSARSKAKLFRLAWEMASDGFAGRQTMYELFNATNEHALRERLLRDYDRSPHIKLAKRIAAMKE